MGGERVIVEVVSALTRCDHRDIDNTNASKQAETVTVADRRGAQ